jgi:hypothetical protein
MSYNPEIVMLRVTMRDSVTISWEIRFVSQVVLAFQLNDDVS